MIGGMNKKHIRSFLVVFATLALTACTSLPPDGARVADTCRDLIRRIDLRVASMGVADAAAAQVPGFPYLKTDRFLASFKGELTSGVRDEKAFDEWVERLRSLDRTARRIELRNLGAANIFDTVDDCATRLLAMDRQDPTFRQELMAAVRAPRHYDDLVRAVGLYPLTQWGAAWGFDRWKQDNLGVFDQDPAIWQATEENYFLPVDMSLGDEAVATLIDLSSHNALAIPDLEGSVLTDIAMRYAPVFAVEQGTGADRIGKPVWSDTGTPTTLQADPVVYVRLSHTRFDGEILPQIVYTIWFPERPQDGPFDILGGAMDGVHWRVTLDRRGRPLVYDTFHACGCYHLFFPTSLVTRVRVEEDDDLREEPIVPRQAPDLGNPEPGNEERMIVHIARDSHYIRGLSAGPVGRDGTLLRLVNEMSAPSFGLRSVENDAGQFRSFFSDTGVMSGTDRPEQFILWPMGIESAGAMRQWGTHATAFVGERHADDPFLLDEAFTR